jgi:hypothetical protein
VDLPAIPELQPRAKNVPDQNLVYPNKTARPVTTIYEEQEEKYTYASLE